MCTTSLVSPQVLLLCSVAALAVSCQSFVLLSSCNFVLGLSSLPVAIACCSHHLLYLLLVVFVLFVRYVRMIEVAQRAVAC